jgi:hypothetical protein
MPEPTVSLNERCSSSSAPLNTAESANPMFLQNLALRYAASELNPVETAAFEARLGKDQDAREALSEAVRLSAAALRQAPLTPNPSLRAKIRERLIGWYPIWLARREYRGHPLAWAGFGALAVATCTVLGLSLTERETISTTNGTSTLSAGASSISPTAIAPEPRAAEPESMAIAPAPRDQTTAPIAPPSCNEPGVNPSVAEIWAALSTPDHIEKDHEEELKWRQKIREIGGMHTGRPSSTSSFNDSREP